ncbi:head maturation protease, ClpP-related [Micromonospora globbae]|uniref:head maturation protease, ClpP-related n=1 Tax=Micromonospora globbae TaxID=1894969 RepID=UPI0034459E9A
MPDPSTAPDGPRPWYHIGPVVALAGTDDTDAPDDGGGTSADVYVYDVIGGWWGLTADDFVRDVASLDVDQIVLHLNTPGGEVSEGVAIANMLRQHRATVRVMVDGMAASSGSVIAMAGDEVVMGLGSQMMVHKARTWAVGDDDEMDKVARMLRSTNEAIASTYAAKAGGSVADWLAVMAAETWYTAEEAVKAGLADRVADDTDKGSASGRQVTPGGSSSFWDLWDSLRSPDRLDLSPFNYRGRTQAPPPAVPARRAEPSPAAASAALSRAAHVVAGIRAATGRKKTTSADPAGADRTAKEAGHMDPAKIREALGLAADAPDSEVTAALAAAGLATAPNPPEPNPEPEPAPRPAAALPPGMRLISDSAWQAQQDRIKKLEAREAKREREERDAVIAQAVKDGKFTPAQRDHFAKLWDADPEGTRNLIASLQKNVALATSELGYASGDPDDEDGEFAEFDALYPPHMNGKAGAHRG